MTDWYSEAREADGRTDDEVMAEVRYRGEAEAALQASPAPEGQPDALEQARAASFRELSDLAVDAVKAAAQVGMFFPALEHKLGLEDGLTKRIAEVHAEATSSIVANLAAPPSEALDTAWAEAEAALPEGMDGPRVGPLWVGGHSGFSDFHRVPGAYAARAIAADGLSYIEGTGESPAAALHALAARLQSKEPTE